MDRDEYSDMFRFRLGDVVQWAEYPGERYYIRQRRWTQREILDPLVEYRLSTSKARGIPLSWIFQQDLAAWEEPGA